MTTTVVLGDDHVVFLEALVTVLEQREFTIHGVADSLAGVVALVGESRPQICLLDRRFADGDGVEGVSAVLAASPQTKVIMLTADTDKDGMFHALQSGAVGYVHKTGGVANLTRAIERVARGEVLIDVPASWHERVRPDSSSDMHRLAAHLTRRERECLALLVEGFGTGQMAKRMSVSVTTVRSHVQSLLTKLGAHSRLEAASFAVRYSLV
ncbi:MAG: response regulator [Pseudonocardiaceae bacterium]|nr:response regulator [Pseudonocardiaceae bacterium]